MEAQISLLKQFVGVLKADPGILHDPKFSFFADYLKSLGATIPPKPEEKKPEPKAEEPMQEEAKQATPEEPMEEEPVIPMPEIDNSGVIEADAGESLPMGEAGKQVSDEDIEKATEQRNLGMSAFSDGDFAKALEHFTAAIELNPGSAILHAKRASALLKLKRPVAAIADCDKAISINPDSAQGYKFRGRANRLLGKWVEAHTDLAVACKLDYDDTANEWLKETEPNAKKLIEYNRAIERQAEEKELRERRERVRKAQEANRKAAEEAKKMEEEEEMGMPPGGMGGFADIFNDPEIKEAMQDPEVMPAFLDIMNNPTNLMKYMNNPKIMKLIGKMKGMPGMGMGGPGMGGMPGGGCCPEGAPCADESCGPTGGAAPSGTAPSYNKAPEPDLD